MRWRGVIPLFPPAAARRPGATPTALPPRAGNNRLVEGLRPSIPPRGKATAYILSIDRMYAVERCHTPVPARGGQAARRNPHGSPAAGGQQPLGRGPAASIPPRRKTTTYVLSIDWISMKPVVTML